MQCFTCVSSHTHTEAYILIDTNTHIYTQNYTLTQRTHTCLHMDTQICIYIYIHTHIHSNIHTYTHVHTHRQIYTHINSYIVKYTHRLTHTHEYSPMHIYLHNILTHIYTHAQKYANMALYESSDNHISFLYNQLCVICLNNFERKSILLISIVLGDIIISKQAHSQHFSRSIYSLPEINNV